MSLLNRLCVIVFFVMLAGCNKGPAAILLFSGTGTSPNDVAAVETILTDNHLHYTTVNTAQLNALSPAQLKSYRLLIVPGGDFMAMGNSLTKTTAANICRAVRQGLNYLGICAGGFLAGSSKSYNGFNLTSGVTFRFYAAADKGIRKAAVAITGADGTMLDQYWEDGPQLSGWGNVVAKYPDGTAAVAEGKCGSGFVILTGIHAEAPADWRKDMAFKTSVSADNAYAAAVIRAALNAAALPHY